MRFLSSIWIGIFYFTGTLMADGNKITTVPLFQSCGISFEASDMLTPCVTEFQEKGTDKWNKAFELMTIPEKTVKNPGDNGTYIDKAMFRGCIVNLKENTEYELRIIQGKNTYTAEFRTWNSNPPVVKILNVKDLKFDNELIITEKGTKDAWIKYTADKGFILKGGEEKNAVITIKGGEYIIIENFKIEGGAKHGISIEDSQNIRILNCDISNYGRAGKQDVLKDGKYYKDNSKINNDAGVNIWKSENIVVDRCYIHDPRGHANSWKYSHPAGPNAIAVLSTGGTVLRYNDFIGSDSHRWNDTVEGHMNNSPTGGFFRDAEIYGNMFIYSNDDGLELDGGQMNIRVFLNRFEASLNGISTGPCLLGPSYLFRNLFINIADEDGCAQSAFKNGSGVYDRGRCYVFNNTVYANGYKGYNSNKNEIAQYGKETRGYTRNNIFYCFVEIFNIMVPVRGNDLDYDLIYSDNPLLVKSTEENLKEKGLERHGIFGKNPEFVNIKSGDFTLKERSPGAGSGIPIDNFIEKHNERNPDRGAFQTGQDIPLPYRPIPVYLDKYQVNFKFDIGEAILSQTIDANVKGVEKFEETFEIRKNNPFDWFTVEPSKGTFKENGSVQFRVSVDKEKIRKIGLYKGLFLIRLESGYSRPVTVYAKVEGKEELKRYGKDFTVYIEAEKNTSPQFKIEEDIKASEGKCVYLDPALKDMSLSYDFEVPDDKDYFIFVRHKSGSMIISVDGEEKRPVAPQWNPDWMWSGCGALGTPVKPVSLKKGIHNVKIFPRKPMYIDMLLITDNYKLVY